MALEKILNARFAQKIDTYANWTTSNETTQANKTHGDLVLKHGEIGFCEVPSGNSAATNAPTILFKVGNGTSAFKDLKWGSALAADVYDWAKAATTELEGQKIVFKKADGSIIHEIDLGGFVTDSELEDILAGYKTKQTAKDFNKGSTIKTVTRLTQNANGEVEVTYDDIAFPAATVVGVEDKAVANQFVDYIKLEDGKVKAAHRAVTRNDIADALAEAGGPITATIVAADSFTANDGITINGKAVVTQEWVEIGLNLKADLDYANETFATKEALTNHANTADGKYATKEELTNHSNTADGKYATKEALQNEVNRATGIEGGLRTDVDAVVARVNAFLDNTGAATDAIDTLQELLTYIETHDDVEISTILADIQALEEKLVLGTYDDNGEAKEYATVKAYVEAIERSLGSGAASLVSEEATARENADKALGERIDAIVDGDEGILAAAKKYTDDEIAELGLGTMSKETATDYIKKTDAPGYADILTKTEAQGIYRTEAQVNDQIDNEIAALDLPNTYQPKGDYASAGQGAKADTALQAVEVGTGLKISEKEDNKQTIEIDDSVVFIFNAGSSTTVI